jgi:hypothetical protein
MICEFLGIECCYKYVVLEFEGRISNRSVDEMLTLNIE